jgi:hypothetical protein
MSTSPARSPQRPPRHVATVPAPAARTSGPAHPAALPLPPDLPAGLARHPRVLQLIDADSVSRGLAGGTPLGRAADQEMRWCLNLVEATSRALDPQSRVRCAASITTATYHLDLLTGSGSNQWSVRRGPGGADQAVLEELNDLIDTRLAAARPGRKRPTRHADLVILVATDRIYAPPVRRLRLLGIPTWLLVPGRLVADSLYAYSCAVSFLSPEPPDLNTTALCRTGVRVAAYPRAK